MPKVVDAAEQRERVIEAAWNVILEDGLDGATMRRIAARAGCTTGLVTHYFTSKEDLLLKMVRHIALRAKDRIDKALEDRHGMAAVRALLIESTPIAHEHADDWRIWLALWDYALTNPRLQAEWNRRSDSWQGLIRQRLEEAVEMQELSKATPIDQLVFALAAFQYGLSTSAVMTREKATATRLVAVLDQQLEFIRSTYGWSEATADTVAPRRRRAGALAS